MHSTATRTALVLILTTLCVMTLPAQSEESSSDDLFSDPFGDSSSDAESDFETGDLGDLDSFFDDEEMIDDIESDPAVSPELDLLVRETTRIGGRFGSRFEALAAWDDYPDGSTILEPTSSRLLPTIAARIFVDARPEDDFRFYSQFRIDYPFGLDADGPDGRVQVPNIEVFELFADVTWENRLFFRIGKSVVNWGVGYLFSPADVISLAPIDPTDPDAEREGPVSLRTHFPFAVHNAYLYLVAGESIADDDKIEVSEISVAPRVELYFSGVEIGIGGFYQRDLSPRGIATLSTSVWDVDLIGEAVLSLGSDRVFIRESDDPLFLYETYVDDQTLYFSGTAGFRYSHSATNSSILAQYLYNGDGYDDEDLLLEVVPLVFAAAAGVPAAVVDTSAATPSPVDVAQANRHYAAAVGSISELFGTDLSASILWQGNLSDGSGLIRPTVTYQLFERASISGSLSLAYGADEREYTSLGARTTASVSLSVGSGSF